MAPTLLEDADVLNANATVTAIAALALRVVQMIANVFQILGAKRQAHPDLDTNSSPSVINVEVCG